MTVIRDMQQADVDAVAALEAQIFSRPWSKQGFLNALRMENTVFLVAEENAKIIGYIGMYCSLDEGEITNVAVHPNMRCRGIGEKLITAVQKEAERKKLISIVLEVRVSNEPAIRLYEKKGFATQGVRKGFYEMPKEDAYIMIYRQ